MYLITFDTFDHEWKKVIHFTKMIRMFLSADHNDFTKNHMVVHKNLANFLLLSLDS